MNKTAKALGYKKGDLVFTGAFPGIIVSDINSRTPCCEVWGYEHESGSCYAHDLERMPPSVFKSHVIELGHSWPLTAYSPVAKEALAALV